MTNPSPFSNYPVAELMDLGSPMNHFDRYDADEAVSLVPSPEVACLAAQGREQTTLGPYYPLGYYFDHAENFDAFVKANGGCAAFAWPRKPPASYRPAGLPGLG